MKVKDIETPDPEVIRPDDTLAQAARKMRDLNIGLLPVCDGEQLLGTITDRDIVIRAIAEGWNPTTAKVRQCMTAEVFCCFEDQNIKEAASLMEEKQVRRLPVLNDQKRLVGIVSLGDVAVRTGKERLAGEILERVSEPSPSEAVMA